MNGQLVVPHLQAAVLDLLKQIPVGKVTTYKDLAQALGDDQSRSARWLGEFLKNHPHETGCACHRVVRSTGEIGHHVSGSSLVKADLLRQEGIAVSDQGQVSLLNRFVEYRSQEPLKQLREFQKQLGQHAREEPLASPPRTIGGLDVAYQNDVAWGVYVLMNATTLELLKTITVSLPIQFPYIPGYLTWRELPVMLALAQQAKEQGALADVLFCDGNGRLHPWRAGIATCLGVLLKHPVVGVAKSLLCGSWERSSAAILGQGCPVTHDSEIVGAAVSQSERFKPIFVSSGHLLTLGESIRLAGESTLLHRLPEPLFLADKMSKMVKRGL